jgi:hypothetical protein
MGIEDLLLYSASPRSTGSDEASDEVFEVMTRPLEVLPAALPDQRIIDRSAF